MRKSIIITLTAVFCGISVWAENPCCANAPPKTEVAAVSQDPIQKESNPVIDEILSKMNEATKRLESCQTNLSYLCIQDPELLDSRTLQNGVLYYQKSAKESHLRIRFDDMQQDDFEPVNQREEYLFDGVWLTRINYKLQQVDLFQQAPEDKPFGVFDLISHNFPLIGFSKINDIKKNFDISLPPRNSDPNEPTCLELKVKKESDFNSDYVKIKIWINNSTYLPTKITAYTTQGDERHIEFKHMEVNKKFKNAVFAIETPAHFRKNIEPLDETP